MNSIGERFRVTLTGTARGDSVGCIIEGIPRGMKLDTKFIRMQLKRRAPRADGLSTPRAEDDGFFLYGAPDGLCEGTLSAVMPNRDVKHGDDINIPRPSHADLVIKQKFGPEADPYDYVTSGRMSAPLVLAGAVAQQILKEYGVCVGAHILGIGDVDDLPFPEETDAETLAALDPFFPLLDVSAGERMRETLRTARKNRDSLGGSVECAAVGLPVGLGEPFFGKLTARIASAVFSVPSVRGVWFGRRDIERLSGSAANDPIGMVFGRAVPLTNRSGGVNGGMANGRPLIVGAAFRPVPTVGISQRTVELESMRETEHIFTSRSDVCVLPRAVPAVEAAVAITLADMMMG